MCNENNASQSDVLTEQEITLLSLYRAADQRGREGIIALIEYISELQNQE